LSPPSPPRAGTFLLGQLFGRFNFPLFLPKMEYTFHIRGNPRGTPSPLCLVRGGLHKGWFAPQKPISSQTPGWVFPASLCFAQGNDFPSIVGFPPPPQLCCPSPKVQIIFLGQLFFQLWFCDPTVVLQDYTWGF